MDLNQRIAAYIGDTLNLDNDNREIVAYSLELILHTALTIILVLFVALIIDSFNEAIILLIVMFLFKSLAGGAHCSSATRCTIMSMLLVPFFGKLSYVFAQQFTSNMLIIITFFCIIFSYVMVYRLAPVNLPIISVVHRRNRRNLSFLLLVILTIVQISIITLISKKTASYIIAIDISIFWQALMLTKPGHALVNCYDKFLLCFVKKGGEKDETH
jgi:accessory gene regulator B